MPESDTHRLPEVTIGNEEPALSSLGIAFSLIVSIVFLLFFSVVFSWESFPALGSIVSVFHTLTGESGVWWYLIGIIGGGALFFFTWLGEVFSA